MLKYKYCGAMHLDSKRKPSPTNILRLCRISKQKTNQIKCKYEIYKINMVRKTKTFITFLEMLKNKHYGALHLNLKRKPNPTNILRLCRISKQIVKQTHNKNSMCKFKNLSWHNISTILAESKIYRINKVKRTKIFVGNETYRINKVRSTKKFVENEIYR